MFRNVKKKLNNFIAAVHAGFYSEKFRYQALTCIIASIHVLLIGIFALLRVFPLALLNIISVITYVNCIKIIRYGYERELIRTFYITYAEIIIHSFVAAICVGWQFGFSQYMIGLIPFGYYMCITLIQGRKKYYIPTLLGRVVLICFICCRMISMFWGSIFPLHVSKFTELCIYIFNSICNFGFLFLGTLLFITDMLAKNNQLVSQNIALDNMASIDPLTGLFNRRSMQDYFDAVMKTEEAFCLVMCDIDNFKKVNDTYGHDFSDVVLKEISRIIQDQVRGHGQVCRWGGEEILILSQEKLDRTCEIAERIRASVSEHVFTLHETSIHCSLTLGVASHRPGNTIEDTITHSDRRLYYGKQNGKNRVVSPFDAP